MSLGAAQGTELQTAHPLPKGPSSQPVGLSGTCWRASSCVRGQVTGLLTRKGPQGQLHLLLARSLGSGRGAHTQWEPSVWSRLLPNLEQPLHQPAAAWSHLLMRLPGGKDWVQPLSWEGEHIAPTTTGQPRDRTDVVASLRGSGSPVQIPYVPVLPDLAAVTQLSEGPPGALLTSSTNMWGTRPGLPVLRPSEPHHPYSGPSPWCLLPGEGRVAPTGEGIRSSPITSDFPMQEAGCSWRGSCELKRTTVLSEGQERRDGVAGPFWAVGSVARVLHLHPTSC